MCGRQHISREPCPETAQERVNKEQSCLRGAPKATQSDSRAAKQLPKIDQIVRGSSSLKIRPLIFRFAEVFQVPSPPPHPTPPTSPPHPHPSPHSFIPYCIVNRRPRAKSSTFQIYRNAAGSSPILFHPWTH